MVESIRRNLPEQYPLRDAEKRRNTHALRSQRRRAIFARDTIEQQPPPAPRRPPPPQLPYSFRWLLSVPAVNAVASRAATHFPTPQTALGRRMYEAHATSPSALPVRHLHGAPDDRRRLHIMNLVW
ncbi:uncharacterized protein LOC144102305 [Amblyomma americanum]